MNRTARSATLVVLVHAGVVFWRLVLGASKGSTPGLTEHQVLAATTAMDSVPTVALVLLWDPLSPPRRGTLLLPLAVGLVIGGSEHFVTPGPLNVFYMATTPWVLPLRVTAVLLLCFGSVWMLDCHSSVQTCSVFFKSRSRAVDQIRNSAEKSNAVPRRPNRPIPKIDYLSAHVREIPRQIILSD